MPGVMVLKRCWEAIVESATQERCGFELSRAGPIRSPRQAEPQEYCKVACCRQVLGTDWGVGAVSTLTGR